MRVRFSGPGRPKDLDVRGLGRPGTWTSERPGSPKDLDVQGPGRPGTWMSERPGCLRTWTSRGLCVRDLSVRKLYVRDLNVREGKKGFGIGQMGRRSKMSSGDQKKVPLLIVPCSTMGNGCQDTVAGGINLCANKKQQTRLESTVALY